MFIMKYDEILPVYDRPEDLLRFLLGTSHLHHCSNHLISKTRNALLPNNSIILETVCVQL